MKQVTLFLVALLFVCLAIHAQEDIFKKHGVTKEPLTLSKGKYKETFYNEEVMQIGTVLINTQTEKVIKFLDEDSTKYAYKAETTSRFLTVDPLAEKYYSWSPYVYVMNNPLKYIDPDGRKIIFIVRDGSKSGQQYTYSNGNFHKSNGDVYHPKEGTTMFKTLVAYKTIGLLNDKTLKNQLSTLENSDLNHFIEEAKPGEGSSVRTFVPGKTNEEMEQMEKDGVPMGTITVLNFSKESQDEFQDNNGVEKTPLTTVTHEQQHQYDYNQGTMTDNDRSKKAKNPAEKRAINNENRVRKDKRTTYGGENVN